MRSAQRGPALLSSNAVAETVLPDVLGCSYEITGLKSGLHFSQLAAVSTELSLVQPVEAAHKCFENQEVHRVK